MEKLPNSLGELMSATRLPPKHERLRKWKLNCLNCGLEAIDALVKHLPSTPDKAPCLYCERNPKVDEEVFDFFSESWVQEQLADGTFEPTIEDPDKAEQILLNVVRHCEKVYGKGGE